MKKKIFLLILTFLFFQTPSNNSFSVEPDEVLKNEKQESRARKYLKI